jgi:hypothetical protein
MGGAGAPAYGTERTSRLAPSVADAPPAPADCERRSGRPCDDRLAGYARALAGEGGRLGRAASRNSPADSAEATVSARNGTS